MRKNQLRSSRAILLLSLFVFASFMSAKFNFHEYWEHYNSTHFDYQYSKDYKKALRGFKWLEKNGNEQFPDRYDYLCAAVCCVKLGDTSNATDYLRKAVIHGYVNLKLFSWVEKKIGSGPLNTIRKEMPDLRKKYYESKISSFHSMLEDKKHTSIDQFVRSAEVTAILTEKDKENLVRVADSINIIQFISSVKNFECDAESFLIYHLYGSNQQYVPFLDSCLKYDLFNGNFSPEAYAFWYDRQRVFVENKPQKYGTYIINYPAVLDGEILNVDSIDFYRNQIGLQPLWQASLQKNFALPNGYKK